MGETLGDVRVKALFNEKQLVTYISSDVQMAQLMAEMREICGFLPDKDFMMKWIDEEGDPCILSSQEELDEALRLYEVNRESEITIHVFSHLPRAPGLPCPGEDKSI